MRVNITVKKKRFNILDVITLVLLVGLIAGVVWRFAAPSANVSSGAKTITYTLKINGVRPFTAPFYRNGIMCFDKKTGDFIGRIKDVRVEKFYARHAAKDGSVYKVLRPNQVVIFLTIEADGRETDDATYAGGNYKLKIGSEINLVTKYSEVLTTVEAIGANSVIAEGELYTDGY